MSVNKVNRTTGDLSLLAGANNTTSTTGVAELSALANIGTSANATQHDINVAIDSKFQTDEADIAQNAQDISDIKSQMVKSVNSQTPDASGNIVLSIPQSISASLSGNVLTLTF